MSVASKRRYQQNAELWVPIKNEMTFEESEPAD